MEYATEHLRNVCLVGAAGAGKTQLVEALLHANGGAAERSGAERGNAERGGRVTDFHPREQQLGHSLYPALFHLGHAGMRVNLLDTPGYRDFFGRTLSVMRAVETAVVVVNAQTGLEPMTHRMMNAAAELGLCRVIVVNQIDAEGPRLADRLTRLLDEIQSAFGPQCLPLNLPSARGDRIIDCYFQPAGAATAISTADSAHADIVDQVVELDDRLMELYLEQDEELEPEQLHEPFEQALREGHLVPVCMVSARTGAGATELLEVFAKLMPNPLEGNPPVFLNGDGAAAQPVPIVPDPQRHVVAHVFKVEVNAFTGRLAFVRVHQGTIKPGMQLYVGDARKPVKVAQLLRVNGKDRIRCDAAVPGDICAIPRLEEAHYDAVLHDSHDEDHLHLRSVRFPAPVHGLAIRTNRETDAQKMSDALRTLTAEDPSLQVEHVPALNETVLRGLGEMHLRTVLEDIEERYGLGLETSLPAIAYRETISKAAEGHHRHKKQTGGAGQFGEVYLRVEPLPRGAGFEFVDEVVGGAIPFQFIPAVETGIRQVLATGAISGHPIVDVKVVVYDGKHHAVDSKEIAFVQAGKDAFLDAVRKAAPIVMEPIVEVTITVPADAVGGVTGDLASMRGQVSGTTALSDGRIEISGQAPLEAVQSYHSRLKSLTGGEGVITLDFSHYAPLPEQLQAQLVQSPRSGSRN
jgi:elongation factor G